MQRTGLPQWEVIPWIVDTQHRLVVGGDASLWRRALVQGAVLSFAEEQEHMLKVSEKTLKYSRIRPNVQPRTPTGKGHPKEVFVCALTVFRGVRPKSCQLHTGGRMQWCSMGTLIVWCKNQSCFLIIFFFLSCCLIRVFLLTGSYFHLQNHFSSLWIF